MHMPLLKKLQIENKRLRADINTLPTIKGNGENVTLNGTSDARFKKFEINGNSVQDGEASPETPIEIKNCGNTVNLFDPNGKVDDTHNIFYARQTFKWGMGNNIFELNSNNKICTLFAKIKKNEQIYVQIFSTDFVYNRNGYADNDGIVYKGGNISSRRFGIAEEDGYVYVAIRKADNTVFTDEDVQTLKDSITVSNEFMNKYVPYNTKNLNIISCNRNIANVEDLSKLMSYFHSDNFREELVDNRNCIVFAANFYANDSKGFKGFLNRFKKNTQYKMKFTARQYNLDGGSHNLVAVFYYDDGTETHLTHTNNGNWIDFELISKKDATVKFIAFNYGYVVDWAIDKDTFIIEEYTGEETEYVKNEEQSTSFPLKEGQELCGLKTQEKDLANYIDKKGQAWICDYLAEDGIHKRTWKVQLKSNNIWDSGFNQSIEDNPTYGAFLNVTFGIQKGNLMSDWKSLIPNIGLCTIAKYNLGSETSATEESGGFLVQENEVRIHIPKSSIGMTEHDDRNKIRQAIYDYLDNHEVYLLLAIQEEIIEPYSQEQQEAYDKIKNELHSYKDITHIFSEDEVSPVFDVEAIADLESYINSKLTATNTVSEPQQEEPSIQDEVPNIIEDNEIMGGEN